MAASPAVGTASAADVRGTLRAGQHLRAGQVLTSPNRSVRLAMQRDGNLVLYRRRAAVWSSQSPAPGARAQLRRDGNLVVVSRSGEVLYTTGTATAGPRGRKTRLIVSNSGEAILLRGRTAVPVWSSRVDAYQVSSGQVLRRGQSRRSANGRYIFAMQWDGNAVLYDDQAKQALWAWEWPGRGGSLAMQADGNLVLHSAAGGALTATMTDGNRGARLVVQDDGNAVLYSSVRRPMWCAQLDRQQISAGQTLHPGQSRTSANRRFKLGMQWDGNLVLIDTTTGAVLWASQTGGNPRAVAMLQLDGNFVVLSEGGKALFATHTEGTRAAKMFVQDDGNLVLSTEAGQQVWSKTGRHY